MSRTYIEKMAQACSSLADELVRCVRVQSRVMNWTPEEQAIIAQAVEDLTPKTPQEDLTKRVRDAMSDALSGAGVLDQPSPVRVKGIVDQVLSRYANLGSSHTVNVEATVDQNDPTKVSVLVEFRPVAEVIDIKFWR